MYANIFVFEIYNKLTRKSLANAYFFQREGGQTIQQPWGSAMWNGSTEQGWDPEVRDIIFCFQSRQFILGSKQLYSTGDI